MILNSRFRVSCGFSNILNITVVTRCFVDVWGVLTMVFQLEQWLDLACSPNNEVLKFAACVWFWFPNKHLAVELILCVKRCLIPTLVLSSNQWTGTMWLFKFFDRVVYKFGRVTRVYKWLFNVLDFTLPIRCNSFCSMSCFDDGVLFLILWDGWLPVNLLFAGIFVDTCEKTFLTW